MESKYSLVELPFQILIPLSSNSLELVEPRKNQSSSSTIPRKNTFLVVNKGNERPLLTLNFNIAPNEEKVKPFLLSLLIPLSLTSFNNAKLKLLLPKSNKPWFFTFSLASASHLAGSALPFRSIIDKSPFAFLGFLI